jgi:aspartate/methionine/tyrosine aminotransferase
VLNRSSDQNFSAYVDSIVAAKRLEVCSTSAPQLVVPRVFGDPRYGAHLKKRARMFAQRAEEAHAALGSVPGIRVHKAQGAFYMTVLFEPGVLNGRNRLSVSDPELRDIVERQCKGAAPDWCFTYQLLGATGICVVPLTGFYSPHPGFRFTLLETDDEKRAWIYRTLAEALVEYLESGKTAA